jgi:hypothetical protein
MQPVEFLETRRLLASFTASSVGELITDINAANTAGGANTITLAPGATFTLSAPDAPGGPNGLPGIVAGNDLTILGNGVTVQRSTARGTPSFRLLEVAAQGSLALTNLTLSNGLAYSAGGAIRSAGALRLSGVTIQNCIARAESGFSATGGAIFSSGALVIAGSTIQNNQGLGGDGIPGDGGFNWPGFGGAAHGGGLYVGGGTATITNSTFSSNLARGGNGADGQKVDAGLFGGGWRPGGLGGDAFGGAIYVASGELTVRGTTITRNSATGGLGGKTHKDLVDRNGVARGGGIYIAPAALVTLDAFTQANTKSNTASTSDNDIFGSFTIL